jgi:hypothetical protein
MGSFYLYQATERLGRMIKYSFVAALILFGLLSYAMPGRLRDKTYTFSRILSTSSYRK